MAGEIEFLTDDEADDISGTDRTDTDRTDGQPAARRRSRRRDWTIRGVALAVVLVALIAWIATRPSSSSHPDAALSSAVPSVAIVSASSGPTATDTTVRCMTGAPVETDVAAAMHKFLPSIALDNLSSVRCVRGSGETSRIMSESVSGSYRGLVITVDLNSVNATMPILDTPSVSGATRRATVDSMTAALHVTVIASGPASPAAPEDQMHTLADYLGLYFIL